MERGNKVWRELPLPPLPLSIHRRPAATTTTASGRADDSNCGFPPPIPVLPLAPGCLVAVVQWHSAWCYGFQRSPERARVRLPGSTTGIMTHRATAQPPHQSPFFFSSAAYPHSSACGHSTPGSFSHSRPRLPGTRDRGSHATPKRDDRHGRRGRDWIQSAMTNAKRPQLLGSSSADRPPILLFFFFPLFEKTVPPTTKGGPLIGAKLAHAPRVFGIAREEHMRDVMLACGFQRENIGYVCNAR